MGQRTFVLHSTLAPSVLADALRRSVDEEQWTLFSLSGFRGDRQLLGKIEANSFRLRKRLYGKNDFAPHFYGQFSTELGGTRIDGFFDSARWVKYFMRFWLAGAVLLGGPIFVMTLSDITRGSHYTSRNGSMWVGIIVPPALVLWGIVLPKIGRLLGHKDEQFILQFLQSALGARLDDPNFPPQ